MIKVFALEDLDCANCAAKLENALSKVEGVENVTVNFFAQKLILEADDAVFDDVLKRVLKTTKKTLPIVEVIVS
ncbi:MAG: cation transporter [Clostridia bacterium]|nr:cation transporter [Clostridia bacterium]